MYRPHNFEFGMIGIYSYLMKYRGERLGVQAIARGFRRKIPETKAFLSDLVAAGKIEMGSTGRQKIYFIRSEHEVELMKKSLERKDVKPYIQTGYAWDLVRERVAEIRVEKSLY